MSIWFIEIKKKSDFVRKYDILLIKFRKLSVSSIIIVITDIISLIYRFLRSILMFTSIKKAKIISIFIFNPTFE